MSENIKEKARIRQAKRRENLKKNKEMYQNYLEKIVNEKLPGRVLLAQQS